MTHHDPQVDNEAVATVVDLMRDQPICMMTTISSDQALLARPMTVQEVEDGGDAWLFASADTDAVTDLEADARVNLAFASSDAWVSLAGRAEVADDADRARELWSRPAEAWFDGPEDPALRLVHVRADSAQYWETPGRAATLVSMLTASFTDDPPDVGESDQVDLPG